MKDFQTKKAEKRLEEVTVNGQDIYLNLAAINMLKAGQLVGAMDQDEIGVCLQLAKMLFTEESYKLVEYMDLIDLAELLDIAKKVVDEQEDIATERFSRAE